MTSNHTAETPQQHQDVWDNFQAAWSDIPRDRREHLLHDNLSETCVYTDPNGVAEGYAELTDRMAQTQSQFPGSSFRGDTFTTHHDQAISTWTMRDGDGTPIFTGTSFARYGDDGRLVQMTGFFQPVP